MIRRFWTGVQFPPSPIKKTGNSGLAGGLWALCEQNAANG